MSGTPAFLLFFRGIYVDYKEMSFSLMGKDCQNMKNTLSGALEGPLRMCIVDPLPLSQVETRKTEVGTRKEFQGEFLGRPRS